MIKNSYPGKFLVFEGIDGAGKSTQVTLLANFLQTALKVKVHTTSEPTHNLIGGLIRGQLTGEWKTSKECLQLLFSADRLYHIEKEIVPLLAKGICVISDRYFFSTIAYGASSAQEMTWLLNVNSRILLPDLIVLIKLSGRLAIARLKESRQETALFDTQDILERAEQNFLQLSERFRDITVVVNGEQPKEKIADEIRTIVHPMIRS